MSVEQAYHVLYIGIILAFLILAGLTMIRSVRGPRITDRIMSVNVIGTLVISTIAILTFMLKEDYLLDVALIYAMISFISVLMLAAIYIPRDARDRADNRGRRKKAQRQELRGMSFRPEEPSGTSSERESGSGGR